MKLNQIIISFKFFQIKLYFNWQNLTNQIKSNIHIIQMEPNQIKYSKFQDSLKSIQIKCLPEKFNQIISNQILNIKVNLILFNSNFLSAKEIQLKLNQIF